jgi:electron transport complex protein RnfE
MAGGFALALFILGSVREILGNGSLFGVALFGDAFEPWVVMILPPGGFIMLGLILLVFNTGSRARAARAEARLQKAA